MSTKFVLFAVATAVVGFGLLHRAPPTLVPDESKPGAKSFVKSVPARAKYGLGSAGVFVIGGIVRNMSEGTETELKNMSTALKKKWGRDGDTARQAAETAWTLDSTSLEALKASKPVLAMNSAMKAKNFVQVARSNLDTP
jgi:hypothetical protein